VGRVFIRRGGDEGEKTHGASLCPRQATNEWDARKPSPGVLGEKEVVWAVGWMDYGGSERKNTGVKTRIRNVQKSTYFVNITSNGEMGGKLLAAAYEINRGRIA